MEPRRRSRQRVLYPMGGLQKSHLFCTQRKMDVSTLGLVLSPYRYLSALPCSPSSSLSDSAQTTSPEAPYTLKRQPQLCTRLPSPLPPCSQPSPCFMHWMTSILGYSLQHDGGSGCGFQSTACHDLIGSLFSFLVAHKIMGHLTAHGILNEMK